MKPGRKPGYSPSPETREKMRNAKLGNRLDAETKKRIGESVRKRLSGTSKSAEHKSKISEVLTDYEARCLHRFKELKSEYPEQGKFFEENKEEIVFALRDTRSEKELRRLKHHVEISSLALKLSYEYPSNSVHSVEDLMIDLLDLKRLLANELKVA